MPNKQMDSWSSYRTKKCKVLKKQVYSKSESAAVSDNSEPSHRAKRGLDTKPKMSIHKRKEMA